MKRCGHCSNPINVPSSFSERDGKRFICADCKLSLLLDTIVSKDDEIEKDQD